MRFYSFGTDFKYSLGRITRQEIYTDAPAGGVQLAFIAETAPAEEAGRAPEYYLDEEGRPHVVVHAPTLDYQVIIQACHAWMARQGLPDEPVWFLALPPGKSPEEFLRIRRR